MHVYTGCSITRGTNFNSTGINTPKQRSLQQYVKVQKVLVFGIVNLIVKYGLFLCSYNLPL